MNILRNITIRTVMLCVMTLLFIMTLFSFWVNLSSLQNFTQKEQDNRQIIDLMSKAFKIKDDYFNAFHSMESAIEPAGENMVLRLNRIDDYSQKIKNIEDEIRSFNAIKSRSILMKFDVSRSFQEALDYGLLPLLLAIKGNSPDKFKSQTLKIKNILNISIDNNIEKFRTEVLSKLEKTDLEVKQLHDSYIKKLFMVIIIQFSILVFSDQYLLAMLVRPINRLREHFQLISSGDLSQTIEPFSRNCVGRLVPLLNEMQCSLRQAVSSIRISAEKINHSAGEIANGNESLACRTEQQSASIEQTAASMEEITSIVKISTENAIKASKLSNDATEAAHNGESLINDIQITMAEISSYSNKISTITKLVNDISFQTNILALNASVEAARAGNAGNGFTAVATEVRNLAQSSSQAAKEIADLIHESSFQVDKGNDLVSSAGMSIREILNSIKNVNELINGIASVSKEQREGVSQIGKSVHEIDTTIQYNAALVEEVAATSGELRDQTAELLKSVEKFTLN